MKNQRNRTQIQCPACGAWNNSDASICGECGRILQVQAKPPVDYRRLMPLIIVAVAAFVAVSFWGYLQFTVYDAQRKIADQDYEAAANELMKISFYGKADELLNSPGVENVEAVIYARAKKQYKAENYIGAMEELAKIQVYEDSGTLLADYLTEYLSGYWRDTGEGEWSFYFGTNANELYVELSYYDSDYDEITDDTGELLIDSMSFGADENGNLMVYMFITYDGQDYCMTCTNMQEDMIDIDGMQCERW